jgi:hypothetical protein
MSLDLRLLGAVTRMAERSDIESSIAHQSSGDINSSDEIGESMT